MLRVNLTLIYVDAGNKDTRTLKLTRNYLTINEVIPKSLSDESCSDTKSSFENLVFQKQKILVSADEAVKMKSSVCSKLPWKVADFIFIVGHYQIHILVNGNLAIQPPTKCFADQKFSILLKIRKCTIVIKIN